MQSQPNNNLYIGVIAMKASESVKNYPSKLREITNYAVKSIKSICKNIGPREPGSENEQKAQEFIAAELNSCCDTVSIEEFPVHPNAFLGWIPICSILMSLAAILYNVRLSLFSLVLTVIAIVVVIFEFVLYREILDPFFKRKTSRNVIGIRKPSGELKRRIIISGHIDSSNEWTFSYLGGPKLLIGVMGFAIVGFVTSLVFSSIAIIRGHALSALGEKFLLIFGYVLLAFIPIYFIASFFRNGKRTVMGANDNLTGSLASVAVAKFMQENNIRFENTEIQILVTGSEEAGLRGAKDYCKRHCDENKELETVFCGLDTLKDLEHIAIYSKDLSGTVNNHAGVCLLMKKAASFAGFDLPFKTVTLGASDAAAVTQACIPAATLAAMDPAPARYYHTRLDTDDILNLKCIEVCINIMLETTFLYAENGLKYRY